MNAGRLRLWVALAAVLALTASVASAARTTAVADTEVNATSVGLESLNASGGPIMLEFAGAPSAETYTNARDRGASAASAGSASRAQADQNSAAQSAALAAMSARGIGATPLYQMQTTYNGIAVQAEPGAAAALAALPGVVAVHEIPLVTLENHSSVPLIGAQTAWQVFGNAGAGRSIAVIDTGIDYVHRGFAGPGTAGDYTAARAAANNTPFNPNVNPAGFTVVGPSGQLFPTAKVVGGFDFVGDNYNADPAGPGSLIPAPDRNPLDCNGHGSHVAGSAAGTGVNADFTTYTGPYNAALNTAGMHIGPGVAPRAGIYGLRVFGCVGSTAVTAQAIEWATDPNRDGNPSDHVDVINMSLGSAYGTPDDPSAAASNTAVGAGVIVVTSAGNNTDVTYVTSSPGSAVRALSTASSVDAADRAEAIVIHSPAAIAGQYIGSKSVAFNWNATPSRTGNVYYPATNRFGCSAWTGADAANISGRIVLIDWKVGNDPFPCGSVARGANAVAAGAIGIIMADSTTWLDTAITGSAVIPAMYTIVTTGNALKSQLQPGVVNPAVSATLDSTKYGDASEPGREDNLSVFSSRGPRARDTGLKPDIAAPGQSIWSVGNGSGSRGATNQGTSMASPHIAGTMALLRSAHPSWTVEQLKALAMNTAHHDLYSGLGKTGDKYGVARIGAGRADVAKALSAHSVAYNDDGSGSVSVSFGAVEVPGSLTLNRSVRIRNFSGSTMSYNVGLDERYGIPGVSFSFPDGNSFTVPAGGSTTFRLQLNADASVMRNTRDATIAGVQAGNPRQWLSEASGYLLVRPQERDPVELRVPVYAAARPASTTGAAAPNVNLGTSGGNTGTITIQGNGVNTGVEPLGYLSKVSAFELGITSGPESLAPGTSDLARGADIRYVGAAAKGSNVYFGLSTFVDWATPATDVQFTIQIDRNGDGNPDVQPFNTRFTDSDVFVVAVGAAATGFTNIFNSNVNTAPFNNSVLVMPVPIGALGLPAGQTSFRYRVVGSSRFWGTIDTTPWANYNHAQPGVAFSDGLAATPMYPDLAGQQIGVTLNPAAYAANGSQGVLLLHHFNRRGARVEVLGFVRQRGR